MSKYVIELDSAVYADDSSAETAITSAGATIETTFSFGLTYEITATEEQLGEIAGVKISTRSDVPISAKTEVSAYTTDHLKSLVDHTLNTAYTPKYSGTGQSIYLVDTGVYVDHPEFANATIINVHTNFADDSEVSDYGDTAGHGTGMASMIVGANVGVVPDATLYNVKLFSQNAADITIGEIITAYNAILNHHAANTPSKVKVVALPWTIPQNDFVDAKTLEMNANGLVVVASAGNDGVDVNSKSPAGVEQIITVGALDTDYNVGGFNNLPSGTSSTTAFSNWGAQVDIFAVGKDVTIANLEDGYSVTSGTSIAGSVVAGVAAQFIQAYGSATVNQIKDKLVAEGNIMGGIIINYDDSDSSLNYGTVNTSIATSELAGSRSFATTQSGRIVNVHNNTTAQASIGISSDASNVAVLDFAPLPSWITLDTATGDISLSPTLDSGQVPGCYLFAIKGTIDGDVVVEEYSIGVYDTDESELETASNYYYDADSDEYDEVVNYQVAPFKF